MSGARPYWRPPLGPNQTFSRVFRSLGGMTEDPYGMTFEVLHVEPSKPRQGRVAFADGTDWNPGAGEGLYVYKTAGWVLLG